MTIVGFQCEVADVKENSCPFCFDPEPGIEENSTCRAFFDRFPVSPGHVLIVPRRHVASFFDLTDGERNDMFDLAKRVRGRLIEEYGPAGFNLGLNDGPAAGQTIMHVHLHVIPRYEGDVPDPRGGIRWVFPERARYWEDD